MEDPLQKNESEQNWRKMNYSTGDIKENIFLSLNKPEENIMLDDVKCEVYHPTSFGGEIGKELDIDTKKELIIFVNSNNYTSSGNITELSMRLLEKMCKIPCYIGILTKDNRIIGSIIVLLFKCSYHDKSIISTYTTFLCIDRCHRCKGYALILIRAVANLGYDNYKILHGYYMSNGSHQIITNKLESWYRPINLKKSSESGFTVKTYQNPDKKNKSSIRQKLAYYISKPSIIPKKIEYNDYNIVLELLNKGNMYLTPTRQELLYLSKCFDIYIVESKGLFILLPMSVVISGTGKRMNNAHLVLMIGDVLQYILYTVNECKYDLLYGWYIGDITEDRVNKIKGIRTISDNHIEFYNSKEHIYNSRVYMPIF